MQLPLYKNAVLVVLLGQLLACGGGGGKKSSPPLTTPPPVTPPVSTTPQAPIPIGHANFLSPHASPIVVNDDLVFAVNTAADTVDVIDTASRNIAARINVGIDPVSIAVRPDGSEVWVSNHVSDSVSVIDTNSASPTFLQVVATVQDLDPATHATRFDEPVGIAFASDNKAYVALSSENQVAVVDVASRAVINNLAIPAQDPRAIVVRDNRLYVIPFESNNRTQLSGCTGPLDGDLCTFDATEHSITNNNVLSRFAIVDIIKNPAIPDRDLFVFDTATDQLVEVVDTLGTLLYGIAVDSSGNVFVTQTDARNDANGRAGTLGHGLADMENRAFLNQVTRVDCGGGACGTPEFIDLEPLPPQHPAPGTALATPFAIQISDDDSTLVVSAAGSDQVVTMDSASGAILGRVDVDAVPRGIALASDAGGQPLQAWVLNAVANTVSLIDLSDLANPAVAATIALDDPTDPVIKAGRIAFNTASAATTATFSCESCHPDGGTDQLLWVLETPLCDLSGCTQIPPRITMPIRGLRDTAPYHWDGIPGDPYGGNNTSKIFGADPPNCDAAQPETCTRFLVDGGLATTMCAVGNCASNDEGKPGALSAAKRDAMAAFLLNVPYPPAQRRAFDNVLSSRAQEGFKLFHVDGDLQGNPPSNVCGNCHRMPFLVSTNSPGTGMDAPTWRGAYDRWLILPQGRLNIIDFNFYNNIAAAGTPEREVWRITWGFRTRFDPVWDMVVEGSTGFSGSFARQLTLDATTAGTTATTAMLDALERSAGEGGIVLLVDGVFINAAIGTPVMLQFDAPFQGGTYVERVANPASWSRQELLTLAASGEFVGTFTARLGANVGNDNPQPAIWTQSSLHTQSGAQQFPQLTTGNNSMTIRGRHIQSDARILVDGRAASGTISCAVGSLPGCSDDSIEVWLEAPPVQPGTHFLQVQNPDGLFSNDFMFVVL